MPLHYLNRVPRAARSGRTTNRGKTKARLLARLESRQLWGHRGGQHSAGTGGGGWRLKGAAFRVQREPESMPCQRVTAVQRSSIPPRTVCPPWDLCCLWASLFSFCSFSPPLLSPSGMAGAPLGARLREDAGAPGDRPASHALWELLTEGLGEAGVYGLQSRTHVVGIKRRKMQRLSQGPGPGPVGSDGCRWDKKVCGGPPGMSMGRENTHQAQQCPYA